MRGLRYIFVHCVAFLGLIQNAFATSLGPYMGIQGGWGDVHQGEVISTKLEDLIHEFFPDKSIDSNILFNDTGSAFRIFAGYQFIPYFAIETGYSHFTNENVNIDMDGQLVFLKYYTIPITLNSHATVSTYSIDVVGKGIWPVTQKLSLYGKLGAAYINSQAEASITTSTPIGSLGFIINRSVNLVYPTFGIGLDYDMTPHVSADLAYNRIQQVSPCQFPSIDLVSFGLIYHFN